MLSEIDFSCSVSPRLSHSVDFIRSAAHVEDHPPVIRIYLTGAVLLALMNMWAPADLGPFLMAQKQKSNVL